MKRRLFFLIGGALLVAGIGIFFLLRSSSFSINIPGLSGAGASNSDTTYTDRDVGGGAREFIDTRYGFSIQYPGDLKLGAKDESGGAYTFTFENDSTAQGFQIFIVPFEGSQITDARFKLDEPSGVRDSLQNVTIDGATGASFFGKDAVLGDTAEVWFIHGGYLYEVTALKIDAQWLSTIMATWKFL